MLDSQNLTCCYSYEVEFLYAIKFNYENVIIFLKQSRPMYNVTFFKSDAWMLTKKKGFSEGWFAWKGDLRGKVLWIMGSRKFMNKQKLYNKTLSKNLGYLFILYKS